MYAGAFSHIHTRREIGLLEAPRLRSGPGKSPEKDVGSKSFLSSSLLVTSVLVPLLGEGHRGRFVGHVFGRFFDRNSRLVESLGALAKTGHTRWYQSTILTRTRKVE